MFSNLINFIQDYYNTKNPISLHEPKLLENESKFLNDALESGFVSSIGEYVDEFEKRLESYTQSEKAIVTMNGTSAIHASLILSGVTSSDIVITQALTFVATANAIKYCGAEPIFVDVDIDTMGLSPDALSLWLNENVFIDDQEIPRLNGSLKRIGACLPMHTFGHPCAITKIVEICNLWNIAVIEDAAESLGSSYLSKHTGTFGLLGTLSFNGNKIITSGGGGAILTNTSLGEKAKHLTTTAKINHKYEFLHDVVGYNYRMPNINAALGCAQLESLESFVLEKRELARKYQEVLNGSSLTFFEEPNGARSNYWLNSVICEDKNQRDHLLKETHDNLILSRPIWTLMTDLPMYNSCLSDDLKNSKWLCERVVNLPSSIR